MKSKLYLVTNAQDQCYKTGNVLPSLKNYSFPTFKSHYVQFLIIKDNATSLQELYGIVGYVVIKISTVYNLCSFALLLDCLLDSNET